MLDHACLIFFDFLYIIVGLLAEFIYIGLIFFGRRGTLPRGSRYNTCNLRVLTLLVLCFWNVYMGVLAWEGDKLPLHTLREQMMI